MVAAVGCIETAAHLAERGDDFVRRILRVERPDQGLLVEGFVRKSWKWFELCCCCSGCGTLIGCGCVVQFAHQVVRTVSHVKFASAPHDCYSGGLIETRAVRTIREASAAACDDACRAVGRDLDHTRAIELGDIKKVV